MRVHHTLAAIALLLLAAGPAAAQRGMMGRGPMRYDTTTVQSVSGTVQRIESPAGQMRGADAVQVLLRTGSDTLLVHLGPSWYQTSNGFALAVGDHLDITGSKITYAGRTALIAAEVKKGGRTLKLRDARGLPLWAGHGRGRPPRS